MEPIVIETQIKSSIETVWNCFTTPEHVMGWNFATEDWCCPSAESDFVVGGKFCYNMAAKDGSMSFDYWGIFRQIQPCHSIEYSLGEDLGESRWVKVEFMELADAGIVSVKETFVVS